MTTVIGWGLAVMGAWVIREWVQAQQENQSTESVPIPVKDEKPRKR